MSFQDVLNGAIAQLQESNDSLSDEDDQTPQGQGEHFYVSLGVHDEGPHIYGS
eukprot:m.89875 g.89875  ORF g.89875 m.89875 type:complete len:53 (-) comp14868_c3_seq16:445-603(-)